MNSLIRAIQKNTEKRKRIKERIDSEINLSVENTPHLLSAQIRSIGTNRLIDEGAIIEGDGSVWAYIEKGTLSKFMNRENVYLENLPIDYVGNINIGHLDHATFPFPVGEWSMSDMHLVDIGDGRQGIDVNVRVDEESVFIKELKRLGYELGVSIEAFFHLDLEATEDLGYPMVDEILIYAYAIVGDGKNVNSNGLELKGETSMKDIEEIVTEVEETTAELSDEALDPTVVESGEESEVEETEASEDVEETEEETEEESAEESDDEEGEEDEAEEADELSEVLSTIETLNQRIAELTTTVAERDATIAELTETISSMKKSNRKLSNKLASEKEKRDKFLASAKGIIVEPLPNETSAPKHKNYMHGDGITE